ncbi:hypothetical protein ECBCE019MS13_0267 [Escherichia coli BCE019_MS-13]|nr:hypothetical protein ECBCE019MS13_0267 [Escherichia coli BCE019_MS-13]
MLGGLQSRLSNVVGAQRRGGWSPWFCAAGWSLPLWLSGDCLA